MEAKKVTCKGIAKSLREDYMIDTMSPEEYAGRYSHGMLCFGLHTINYDDPELEDWLTRLAHILRDEEHVEKLREKYLSPDELAKIKALMDKEIDYW